MTVAGLVINLGLKSVRAIAFDGQGRKLAAASRPVHTYLRDAWMEQDPAEWWAKAVASTKSVVDDVGSTSPGFLTVTASAACLVPIDADGRPLRRAIMVGDRRAVSEAERLSRLRAFAQVRTSNGSFVPDPYFLLPKALWFKEQQPEIYGHTRWLMSPGDFLLFRMAGIAVTDPLNAEKFFYNVETRRYPDELLAEAGLDPARLPPVAPLGDKVGALTQRAATELGLSTGIPVVLSTYDAICAFWGSGVSEPGDVADVSGTVTSVRMLSDRRVASDEHRIFAQAMPGVSQFALGGSNNLGGGLVEWLKQSFYAAEARPYECMEAEADVSRAGARGILFLPFLLGERCPIWDPDARGVFFGLERQHERGDFARAVLESTAFGLEHILRTIREHGVSPQRVRVSGGLARIRLVSAIKADVTGLPTEVLEEFETAALGAFLIGGTGYGLFGTLQEAARVVRVREVVLPNEDNHDKYRDWFALYLQLYESLRGLFGERQRLFIKHGFGGAGRLENL